MKHKRLIACCVLCLIVLAIMIPICLSNNQDHTRQVVMVNVNIGEWGETSQTKAGYASKGSAWIFFNESIELRQTSGSLPPGMSISGTFTRSGGGATVIANLTVTAKVSGTPTQAGTYNATFTTYYQSGGSGWIRVNNCDFSFSITVTEPVMSAKVNGGWVDGEVSVKVNGSWVKAKHVYVKVNGNWVESRRR